MFGVMKGAINVGAVFGRVRREVHFDVVDTDSTTEVRTITPLEHFVSKHRNVKAHIPFSTLNPSCRNDFNGRAAEYYIEHVGGIVTYIFLPSKSLDNSLWQSPLVTIKQCYCYCSCC